MHPLPQPPRYRSAVRSALPAALVAALLATAAACGGPAPGPPADSETAASVTLLSGLDESLVRPLLERFLEDTGTEVEVRYGDTGELAAMLLGGEGPPPADVFLSAGAAPLGALAAGGLLRPLPRDVLDLVPGNLEDPDGLWVGLSGRARTVVYDTRRRISTRWARSASTAGGVWRLGSAASKLTWPSTGRSAAARRWTSCSPAWPPTSRGATPPVERWWRR
jgi:hypothetical protein